MAMTRWAIIAGGLGPVALLSAPAAATTTIDFDGLSDGTAVTTQYSGVTFSGAAVATAGITLNEFDFPPKSGLNVVLNQTTNLQVDFSTAAQSVSGFVTGTDVVTLSAFDGATLLGSIATTGPNFVSSGNAPNQFLSLSFANITSVRFSGPGAFSFTLDDLSYSPASGAVPEPASWAMMVGGLLVAGAAMRRRKLAIRFA
jgi:hypothetical protein